MLALALIFFISSVFAVLLFISMLSLNYGFRFQKLRITHHRKIIEEQKKPRSDQPESQFLGIFAHLLCACVWAGTSKWDFRVRFVPCLFLCTGVLPAWFCGASRCFTGYPCCCNILLELYQECHQPAVYFQTLKFFHVWPKHSVLINARPILKQLSLF